MLMQYDAFLLDIEKYDFVIYNILKEILSNSIKKGLHQCSSIFIDSMFYSSIFKDFLGIEYI